jgi:hypothetical protein
MKSPQIYKNFLENSDLKLLKDHIVSVPKNQENFSEEFSRHEFGGTEVLNYLHNKIVPYAKEFFGSENLLPTFNFGVTYSGKASLLHHTDVAACTYSIDLCVSQIHAWDLWVEGKSYTLEENDALFYYGEGQEHWRDEFPFPETNTVSNAFFFFAEPDHWYFKNEKDKHFSIMQENYKNTIQYRNEVEGV